MVIQGCQKFRDQSNGFSNRTWLRSYRNLLLSLTSQLHTAFLLCVSEQWSKLVDCWPASRSNFLKKFTLVAIQPDILDNAICHNQFMHFDWYWNIRRICDDVNLVCLLWPQRAVSAGEAEWWEPSACRPTELSAEAVAERPVRCWVKQRRPAGRRFPVPIISSLGGIGCKPARLAVTTNRSATIPTMETTRVAAAATMTTTTINLLLPLLV